MAKPNPKSLPDAIRSAAEQQGLSIEAFRRQHDIPNAWFYGLLRNKAAIPERTQRPLRKLKEAGVRHPLLDLVA